MNKILSKDKRAMSKGGIVWLMVAVFVVAAIALLGTGVIKVGTTSLAVAPSANAPTAGNPGTQSPAPSGTTTYQPTASYSAIDKFGTTSITGTSYYQSDGQKATTTAASNVNAGTQYTYWVDNGTGGDFVNPAVFTATQGVNTIVANGWLNASPTLTAYDNNAGVAIAAASHNVTLGASGQANIDLKYQGTAKKSGAPFGGIMVLEYNSTISSATVSSPFILASNPYTYAYTVQNTADVYKEYAFSSGLDDGSGNLNHITLQFTNGATAQPTGGAFYVYFYPANYYVTNSGNIVLDVTKSINGDTTRTTTDGPYSLTMFWA